MMRRFGMAALCALAMAVPARAQIALEPGQAITLSIGEDGDTRVTGAGRAEVASYDQAFLAQLDSQYKAGEDYKLAHVPEAPPIRPDSIEMRFVVIDGRQTMLAIANGYDDGVTYRATIHARGRTTPTDVCLVLPGKRGYEHWPYAIDRIEMSAFRRTAWTYGDPIPCI